MKRMPAMKDDEAMRNRLFPAFYIPRKIARGRYIAKCEIIAALCAGKYLRWQFNQVVA